MYSPKAILAKQPVAIAAVIRSVLYALILGGVLHWDAMLLAGVALALEGVLGLFSWSQVTPNATAQANADAAYSSGVRAAQAVASGTRPDGG